MLNEFCLSWIENLFDFFCFLFGLFLLIEVLVVFEDKNRIVERRIIRKIIFLNIFSIILFILIVNDGVCIIIILVNIV